MTSTTDKPVRLCDALSLENTGSSVVSRRASSPVSSPSEIRRKRGKRGSAPCLMSSSGFLTVQSRLASAGGLGVGGSSPGGGNWRIRSDVPIHSAGHTRSPDIPMPRSPHHTADNRNHQTLPPLNEIGPLSASPRSPGRDRRRCSASAILEPIHEGLPANRRNSTPALLMTRCAIPGDHMSSSAELECYPRDLSPDQIRSRRRRSLPEIPTFIRSPSPMIIESLYPSPRKNSLVSSTLGELVSQYELLNLRSSVPEEIEDVTNNTVLINTSTTTNNNNNNNDIVSLSTST